MAGYLSGAANEIVSRTRFNDPGSCWWLSQIVLYSVYAMGGSIGLAVLTGVLAMAAMALIYSLCSGDPIVRAFAVILGAAASALFWSARPQMFSFVLSAIVVYLLWLYQKRRIDSCGRSSGVDVVGQYAGGFAIGFILLCWRRRSRTLLMEVLACPNGGRRSQAPAASAGDAPGDHRRGLAIAIRSIHMDPQCCICAAHGKYRRAGISFKWAADRQPRAWPFISCSRDLLVLRSSGK
jgi:hypothetical protein